MPDKSTDNTPRLLVYVTLAIAVVAILLASFSLIKPGDKPDAARQKPLVTGGDDQPVIMAGGSLHMLAPYTTNTPANPQWTLVTGSNPITYQYKITGQSVQSVDLGCDNNKPSVNFPASYPSNAPSSVAIKYQGPRHYHLVTYTINAPDNMGTGTINLKMTRDSDTTSVGASMLQEFITFGNHPHSNWSISGVTGTGFLANANAANTSCSNPNDGELYMVMHVCSTSGSC